MSLAIKIMDTNCVNYIYIYDDKYIFSLMLWKKNVNVNSILSCVLLDKYAIIFCSLDSL